MGVRLFPMGDCDVYGLFPNADDLLKVSPWGYILDISGCKVPFWDTQTDPLNVPGCQMALIKFLDGSPVAVRYKRSQFVEARMCPKCYRDLDFIFSLRGQEGLMQHWRSHEVDNHIEALKIIRDLSKETYTQAGIDAIIKVMKKEVL